MKGFYWHNSAHRQFLSLCLCVLVALAGAVIMQLPGSCTRLPPEARESALKVFATGSMRLDGSISLPNGSMALPLLPTGIRKGKQEAVSLPANAAEPTLVLYENGWGHLRLERKGEALTVVLPAMPEPVKKRLLAMRLPGDLIVPEGIVLPRTLKPLLGDLNIALLDDEIIARPDFGQKKQPGRRGTGPGLFALASVSDGSIILVDGNTFNKVAEFPTEGTPCGMDLIDNKIYITDQAKNRILLLDPLTRRFLGQVDLPAGSTPKGIASLPNGKLTYVSESGPANVSVMETATGKILVKTKVPTGPSTLAMTSDGIYLLVLSATSGDLSVMSTYNQKVVGSVKVGAVPSYVAVNTKDRIAYVTNRRANSVSVVDFTRRVVLNTIKVAAAPTGIVLSLDGSKLFVAHAQENTIWVIDTKTLQKLSEVKLPLDVDFPGPIALTPDGKKLVVTSQQTDTIGVIDSESLEVKKLSALGHRTHAILWVPND